jgi:CRISPR-associated protein Cpf1
LNAYQLTSKFVSFQKLGKQSGFLFYTPAWNTSKIDPVTGFVNLFDTRYETREKARAFFGKFDFVRYNANKDWFEFAFDYDKFTTKSEGTRTRWTLCTQGMRIETYRDASKNSQWASKSSDLTNLFKEFFAKHAISLDSNLKEAIANQDSREFYEELLRLFRLTLQMRNSISNSEQDYLLSPVADENGNYFNSEEEKLKGKDEYGNWKSSLPVDADANGAYNIARKGLWMIRQIKNTDNLKKMNLAISNKEWLKFVQEKPYLDD